MLRFVGAAQSPAAPTNHLYNKYLPPLPLLIEKNSPIRSLSRSLTRRAGRASHDPHSHRSRSCRLCPRRPFFSLSPDVAACWSPRPSLLSPSPLSRDGAAHRPMNGVGGTVVHGCQRAPVGGRCRGCHPRRGFLPLVRVHSWARRNIETLGACVRRLRLRAHGRRARWWPPPATTRRPRAPPLAAARGCPPAQPAPCGPRSDSDLG